MRTLKIYLTTKQYRKVRELAYKKTATLSYIIRSCIDEYPGAKDLSEEELFMKELEEIVKKDKQSKLKRKT